LQRIVSEFFDNGIFENTINNVDYLIKEYVRTDASAFYTYDQYIAGVNNLKEFGKLRAQSIKGQLNGVIPSTTEGQIALPGSLINTGSLDLNLLGIEGKERKSNKHNQH
jgi:hypothetical protein